MNATLAELQILHEVAEALNRTSSLDDALGVVLDRVAARFALPTGWIWLLDDSGDAWVAAARNLPPALADDPQALAGSCWCLDGYKAGKLDSSTNVTVVHCSRLKDLVHGTAGLQYHQSVPVCGDGGRRVGLLNVASPDWRELTPAELRLLVTIGDMLGLAVERSQRATAQTELAAVVERNRIAREIHDTIAQSLVGAALQLEAAEANLDAPGREDRARRAVGRALELVRGSLEDARRSVLDLRAAPLEGRSLAEALSELVGDADFSCTGVGALSARVELGVYRVAQEALCNTRTHARASSTTVRLTRHAGALILTVEDDGVGFDSPTPGRFGLVGMRERARLLGGQLAVESAVGRGTFVRLTVPLDVEEP